MLRSPPNRIRSASCTDSFGPKSYGSMLLDEDILTSMFFKAASRAHDNEIFHRVT